MAPRIVLPAMLSLPSGPSSWLSITAIEPATERLVTPRRFSLVASGHALEAGDSSALWLQDDVAHGLEMTAVAQPPFGDPSTWPALLARDRDEAPNGIPVQLTGTFQSAMPGDRRIAAIPLFDAQTLLRMEGSITSYALAIDPLDRADEIAARLQTALGPEFEVHTWRDLAPLLAELHGYQDRIFALLSALMLAVVILTALNNMLMNVLERTREIGTLLALGLRRSDIARLFLLEGTILGGCAGLVGLTVGNVAVQALDAAGLKLVLAGTSTPAQLHFHVGLGFVALLAAVSVLCTSLAALWPARHASRLAPVVALRSR